MSKILTTMIEDGKGYRTETFRGSGERNIRNVVSYEINELGNLDIPTTMEEIYDDFDISRFSIKGKDISCFKDEEIRELIDIICNYISKKVNKKEKDIEVLWLTTKENVIDLYLDYGYDYSTKEEADNLIDSYNITEKNFVLSDINYDGVLFVY